jgi:NifU-like protein
MRGLRLTVGKAEQVSPYSVVRFHFLVDEMDGIIADSCFQAMGPALLLGACDMVCELSIRKNYQQVRRISIELLERALRDKSETRAFPEDALGSLNLLLYALEDAMLACEDIPLGENYTSPPAELLESAPHPGWLELSVAEKIQVIEDVIKKEIRPYVELDAGGVEVINLIDDKEVVIRYEGSCTTCHSATGSTLSAIQQILRARVHPQLFVTPNL